MTKCKCCEEYAAQRATTTFHLGDTQHRVPTYWLAGRARGGDKTAFFAAMRDWADQCELAAQFEAERA